MIITKQIAKELGCYESAEIEGVTYMYDPYKEDYSIDGSVSYFHALKIGADVNVDDIDDLLFYTDWYMGYPMYDGIPNMKDDYEAYVEWANDNCSEWSDIYNVDKPFLYQK